MIGHGYGGDAQRLTREQRGDPRIGHVRAARVAGDERGHTVDQQPAQVLVAHFGDPPKPLLAATAVLQRGQPRPGGELPP
jgi:hypothetical protein